MHSLKLRAWMLKYYYEPACRARCVIVLCAPYSRCSADMVLTTGNVQSLFFWSSHSRLLCTCLSSSAAGVASLICQIQIRYVVPQFNC